MFENLQPKEVAPIKEKPKADRPGRLSCRRTMTWHQTRAYLSPHPVELGQYWVRLLLPPNNPLHESRPNSYPKKELVHAGRAKLR